MSPAPLIAQITDPHLRRGDRVRELALAAAVDAVLALGVAPAVTLVTGDVADTGHPDEYAAAASELARLPGRVVLLAGNHDDRAGLRAAFGLPGAPSDPVRGTVEADGLRIVAADTTIPGADDGTIDVPWIAERLAEDRVTPTLLALHHPPLAIGSLAIDWISVPGAESAALGRLLRAAPNVRGVLCGHVHRGTLGRLGGVPVVTAPSSNMQLAFELVGEELEVAGDEPSAVALHALIDGRLVTHVLPVRSPRSG